MNIEVGEGSFAGFLEDLLLKISQTPMEVMRVVSQRLQAPRNGALVFGRDGSYHQELYRRLPVSCFVADFEGRILDVNQAWCESFGYSAAEAINRCFVEFVLPGDISVIEQGFMEMRSFGKVNGRRFAARHKSGQTLTLQLSGTSAHFSSEVGNRFFVCVLQALPADGRPADNAPIPTRKGSPDQANMLSLIESSEDPIWMVDQECCLVLGNSAFYQSYETSFGYRPRPGESIFPKNVEADFFVEWRGHYSRALGGEKHTIEMALVNLSPPRHTEYQFSPVLDDRGRVAGVSVIAHNVTTRRMIEEALRETNDRLLSTLDSIDDGFFAMDHDLVIRYFNQAASSVLNRKVEEVIDRYVFDAFPELEGSVFEEQFLKAVFEGEKVTFETSLEYASDTNWYEVRLYPHKNGLSVFFDTVTERKKAEDEVRSALLEKDSLLRELNHRIENTTVR